MTANQPVTMLAAMMPSPFVAAASYDGSPDQSRFFSHPNWRALAPFNPSDSQELRLRSPTHFVGGLHCPLYAFVSSAGPYRQAHGGFEADAGKFGKTCKVEIVQGTHSGIVPPAIATTIAWFGQQRGNEAVSVAGDRSCRR